MSEPTQDELGKFVAREVMVCQSSLVDQLLKDGVFSFDDIINLYSVNIESAIADILEEIEKSGKLDFYNNYMRVNGFNTIQELSQEQLEQLIDDLDLSIVVSDYDEPNEILEWWVISDWLQEKLEEFGEPILDNDYGSWWGRTCSGQAILLDWVIRRIYKKYT